MKVLFIISSVILVIGFMAVPAFPISYELDVGGDGIFDTGETVNISPQNTATIDFYIGGYSCPPDDLIFNGRAYFIIDESIIQVTSCFPYCGPFDLTLSGCSQMETNVYLMVASNFSFVQVLGGQQKFGTIEIEFLQHDEYVDLVAATDLTAYGYPIYNDCFIADCNLVAQLPDDGAVRMIRTTDPPCLCDFNGDGRVGLADAVIMKEEFLRTDCDINPCQADCNGDGQVNLADLTILKNEFTRSDCAVLP